MKLPAVLVLVFNAALTVAQSQPAAEIPVPAHLAPEAALALAEKKVPAAYPEKARASGIQGNVVLRVLIAETGEVRETTVISGDPSLAQAAIDAIKQWKYKPYVVDGKPVPVKTQVTFGFHIKPPPLPPPLGRFEDGQYQNEFFGISYPLSAEWVRETSLIQKKLASDSSSQSSSRVLLAALHVPSRSDGLAADSSLVLMAAPQPAQTDAMQYLTSVSASLGEEKVAKPRGEITQLTFAGLTAYRADFRPSGSGAKYQSIVCAVAKGDLLRWNFLAVSETALDGVVGAVSAITQMEPSHTTAADPNLSLGSTEEPKSDLAPVVAMRVSSGVTAGLLIKRVEPIYPPDAKSAHIHQLTFKGRFCCMP